ncbi:hypothetical protein DFH06DRAFT_465973 [Mycena polygramma]|nr:hypothetical protein DFH06DRAFT_465973 [Mycena polygramma]
MHHRPRVHAPPARTSTRSSPACARTRRSSRTCARSASTTRPRTLTWAPCLRWCRAVCGVRAARSWSGCASPSARRACSLRSTARACEPLRCSSGRSTSDGPPGVFWNMFVAVHALNLFWKRNTTMYYIISSAPRNSPPHYSTKSKKSYCTPHFGKRLRRFLSYPLLLCPNGLRPSPHSLGSRLPLFPLNGDRHDHWCYRSPPPPSSSLTLPASHRAAGADQTPSLASFAGWRGSAVAAFRQRGHPFGPLLQLNQFCGYFQRLVHMYHLSPHLTITALHCQAVPSDPRCSCERSWVLSRDESGRQYHAIAPFALLMSSALKGPSRCLRCG